MIKVKSITLIRYEGPTRECDIPVTCLGLSQNIWEQANQQLVAWSHTAPFKGGGYDKCGVTILYEDGYQHRTRYDLHHHSVETPNLAREVRAEAEFYAGTRKPDRMTIEQYAMCVNRHADDVAALRKFVKEYDLGYNPAHN